MKCRRTTLLTGLVTLFARGIGVQAAERTRSNNERLLSLTQGIMNFTLTEPTLVEPERVLSVLRNEKPPKRTWGQVYLRDYYYVKKAYVATYCRADVAPAFGRFRGVRAVSLPLYSDLGGVRQKVSAIRSDYDAGSGAFDSIKASFEGLAKHVDMKVVEGLMRTSRDTHPALWATVEDHARQQADGAPTAPRKIDPRDVSHITLGELIDTVEGKLREFERSLVHIKECWSASS